MKLQVIFSKAKQLSKIIQFISLLLFFLFSKLSYGQLTYPVNVSTSVPGPSPMLADYQVSGRIVFNVNLNDMQIGNRDVKFKIKIESQGGGIAYSAVSKTNAFSNKVTLYSGMPAVLKGEDLSVLFDWENNLLISSPYQYASQGVMPEGLYTIKLIAYDYALGYQLSNAEIGFATLFISHLQPPILTLPLTQSNINIPATPGNSTYFSWIPRNNGAPLGKEIKYRLLIYPILSGQTAGTAINNTPLLTVPVETENPFHTLQHYDFIADVASYATPGVHDFAWRVQAYFVDNNYNPIFANRGFSEIFTFTTYTPCTPPILAPSTLNNAIPLQLTANWVEPTQTEFAGSELHYREKSRWTSWNLVQLPDGVHTKILNDLKADTYYEAMVRSVCTTGTKTYYSEWINFIDTKTDVSDISTVACIAPYNVQFSNAGSTININWTEGNEDRISPVYTVQYKLKSSSTWTTAANNITATSYSLSSLPNGNYDIRVGSNCADFTVSYSDVYSLTVPVTGTLSNCNFPLPFDVKVEVIEGREQTKISWPSDNNEQVYKFYYRKRFEEGAVWETIITGVSYIIIDSLHYGESYECKIEKDCGGGVVVTSPLRYFQLDDPYLTSGNGTNNSGDCFPPDYATAAVKGTEEAPQIEFSWKANPNAQSYKLKYRIQGVTDFESVIVNHPTNKYLLSLLEVNLNQIYEYTVEARCDNKWSIPTQLNTIKLVIDPNMSLTCDTVVIAAAQLGDTTMSSFKVRWTQIVSATGYIIEYRPLTSSSPAWYSMPLIPQPSLPVDPVIATVDKLDQEAVYEYRVKTICGSNYSDYTNIRKIKTLKNADVDCGSAGDDANLVNQDPLLALEVDDEIHANDFTLTVTEVTSSAGGGVFSGKAEVEIKLWGSLTFFAEFENAKFNTDHRLIDGKVILKGAELQYLPDEVRNTINTLVTTIGDSFDKLQQALDIIYDLGGIERKDPVGQSAYNPALVTTPGVNTGAIKLDKATGTITNSSPQFGVNAGTTIAVINKDEADAIKATLPTDENPSGTILDDATGKPSVTFSMFTGQKYGYDKYEASTGRLAEIYENASGTYIDWKSIGAGLLDRINVTIGSGSAEEIAKIKFISLAGIEYKLQEKDGQKFILVSGSLEGTVQEVYAWYSDGTSSVKIAKINVAAYKSKKNKVYMVPVNGATLPSGVTIQNIQTDVRDIYKGSIMDWEVLPYGNFDAGYRWDLVSDGEIPNLLDVTDTDLLSAYSDEMKFLIADFLKKESITNTDNTIYYMFYGLNPDDNLVTGFTPRSKNIGFIFDKTSEFPKTLAHELGHGLTLNHTWKEEPMPSEGATTNLMDYTTPQSTELWKSQWEIIQYPKVVVAFLDDEEDAMKMKGNTAKEFLLLIREARITGNIIKIPSDWVKQHPQLKDENDIVLDGMTYENIKIDFSSVSSDYSIIASEFYDYMIDNIVFSDEYGFQYKDKNGLSLIKIIIGSAAERYLVRNYIYGSCGDIVDILTPIHEGYKVARDLYLTYSDYCDESGVVDRYNVTLGTQTYEHIYINFQNIPRNESVKIDRSKKIEDMVSGNAIYIYSTTGKRVMTVLLDKQNLTAAEVTAQMTSLSNWLFGNTGSASNPIIPVSGTQLHEVFKTTSIARLNEVAGLINKYSREFEIDTKEKLSNFIGQMGAETKFNILTEGSYSPSQMLTNNLPRTCRKESGSDTIRVLKYCDLFVSHNALTTSSCPFPFCDENIKIPAHKRTLDVNSDVWYANTSYMQNGSGLTAKTKYTEGHPNNMEFFNYVYACRMDNGTIDSKDGSRFRGRGFIQLTGYYNYNRFQKKWNTSYPTNKKEFMCRSLKCDSTLNELATNLEMAMLAAFAFWKDANANSSATNVEDGTIVTVTSLVNGGQNGITERKKFTKEIYAVLNK